MLLGISEKYFKKKKESAFIMRKQTKLVAVLSTAALLALGASMSSFAATGWQEENGTWVYYDKNGDKETEKWEKSGDNWFYLDDNGEMTTDSIIEYKDNFYYVDENGSMVANKWVSVSNVDYDGEDEPTNYWYYFGSNGKAYTGVTDKANWKTINGKKYTFDEDGKMQFGWISKEDGKRDTADDAWKTAEFYCGDENDGAQAVGWMSLNITDEDYDTSADAKNWSSKDVFDDEDQTRWFYFKSNGKKTAGKDGETINGAKYSFDAYGRMNAEWVNVTTTPSIASDSKTVDGWKYFKSPEDGARVTKGWFKVVPDSYIDEGDNDDGDESWFYADGKGQIYANQIKEISGKRYAFDEKGRMKTGFRLVKKGTGSKDILYIYGLDKDDMYGHVDTEDDFKANINDWLKNGFTLYNFGGGEDGAMKTGKQTLSLDGDSFTFSFSKSGANRGAGRNEVDSDKIYQGGMLLKADKEDKYAVVRVETVAADNGKLVPGKYYTMMSTEKFLHEYCDEVVSSALGKDEKEAYVLKSDTGFEFKLINTSGSVQSGKKSAKDGEDYIFAQKGENIDRIYVKK